MHGRNPAVDVRISNALSKEEADNLYGIFALAILGSGERRTPKHTQNVTAVMKSRYTGGADGETELDAVHGIRLLAAHNVREFNYLASRDGGKTYTIDLCHTITPN